MAQTDDIQDDSNYDSEPDQKLHARWLEIKQQAEDVLTEAHGLGWEAHELDCESERRAERAEIKCLKDEAANLTKELHAARADAINEGRAKRAAIEEWHDSVEELREARQELLSSQSRGVNYAIAIAHEFIADEINDACDEEDERLHAALSNLKAAGYAEGLANGRSKLHTLDAVVAARRAGFDEAVEQLTQHANHVDYGYLDKRLQAAADLIFIEGQNSGMHLIQTAIDQKIRTEKGQTND